MNKWFEPENVISVVLGIITVGLAPIFRFLWKIRYNELHHIQEQLNRIEQKLDNHLIWHLDQKDD